MRDRLPWEIVETLPSTNAELIDRWTSVLAASRSAYEEMRASVALALTLYWAPQEGLEADFGANLQRRSELVGRAEELAQICGDPDCVATALLGELYALWGPDHFERRDCLVGQLDSLAQSVTDPELRIRSAEWQVLQLFETGDIESARDAIRRFAEDPVVRATPMFARREELWRANLAMIDGRIDEALRINTDAISATADAAGSPFSFQNVAVTVAIERYLRRGLDDVVDSVRSIRASSPRVGANWDAGLAFCLAESGQVDEAAGLFEELATDDFAGVPRDLNWLVTMHLLGLVALQLDDSPRMLALLGILETFSHLDAIHGSGYASYGPVGRVVGSLAAATGSPQRARDDFEQVLNGRAPGPWRSLTLLDRGRALRRLDPRGSLSDATNAARELAGLGMSGWADVAGALVAELAGSVPERSTVLRHDSGFELHHDLGVATVSGKGAAYLVRLLCNPGEPHDVVGLEGDSSARGGSAQSSLVESSVDATAAKQYRSRLSELEGRQQPLSADETHEIDFLRRELAGAAFFVAVSAEDERSRVRVTKAIKRSIETVAQQAPDLGAYLAATVSTGRHCMYAPGDGRGWNMVSVPGARGATPG